VDHPVVSNCSGGDRVVTSNRLLSDHLHVECSAMECSVHIHLAHSAGKGWLYWGMTLWNMAAHRMMYADSVHDAGTVVRSAEAAHMVN
jgi:hypothetical protein